MKLNPKCGVVEKSKIVQRVENGKAFRILNGISADIGIYRVDGCLITGETRRCDFLFIIDPKQSRALYLVEFKGTDHVHALRQIITAGEVLGIGAFRGEKKAVIVGSPSPKSASTFQNEYVKLQNRFKAIGLQAPIRKNNVMEVAV